MIDFKALESIITDNQKFLVTTHVNPDADAIGSEIALCEILLKLNKKIAIINHSATPYNLKFLDRNNSIKQFDLSLHQNIFNEYDVLVALDFNRADRMVKMKDFFIQSSSLKICIDHHQDAEDFVDHQFIDTTYSATAHILYDFIKNTNIVSMDYNIALPIYAGIMTDTGSFRFERTTPILHRIVAELLEAGINPSEVYDKIYDQSCFSKIKLLGIALNSLKFYGQANQVAYMVLTQKDFKENNGLESDTELFVNFSLSIHNVKVGILFIELNNGFKVSFRSKGNIPVNKLAGEFGGGGHINAAGARFKNENMFNYIPLILKKSEEYINTYHEDSNV